MDIPIMDSYNLNYENTTQLSEIQSFYNDMTIFLTGATGFMGNLILDKLIRREFIPLFLTNNNIKYNRACRTPNPHVLSPFY